PTKLVLFVSCIYHRMSVYILCTPTKCRLCTTPVVSHPLLPHNPPPSPLPISTRPTSSRWVPPSCPCCQCACTKGVQALGSVKRLETIVLLWRYINKIELN